MQATTPALFGDMKREIKARQDGGWKSVRWSMVKRPGLGQLDILHGRIMAQNPKVTQFCIAFCTCFLLTHLIACLLDFWHLCPIDPFDCLLA